MSNTHLKDCEGLINGLGCTCGVGDWYDDRTILNYCGHEINVLRHSFYCQYTQPGPNRCTCPSAGRSWTAIESTGKARVDQVTTDVDTINGYQVVHTKFTGISGLPSKRERVYLIVSIPVYLYNSASPAPRDDLICVDSPVDCPRDEFTLYTKGIEQRTSVDL